MTGGLQSILEDLVLDVAGPDAVKKVNAAFEEVYPQEGERVAI